MAGKVTVRGLAQLQKAASRAEKASRLEMRHVLQAVAKPVQMDAQSLAGSEISHIGKPWSQMRIGVTRKLVYVAPKQRGRLSRHNPNLRRPNMAGLLMDKAMQPALDRNEARIDHDAEIALERIADIFER